MKERRDSGISGESREATLEASGAAERRTAEPLDGRLDLSSPAQGERLVQALQRRQTELEAQNEQLLRAQAALVSARDRYLELYEQAPVGYVAFGRDELISQANPPAAAMLGRPAAQMLGRRFSDLVVPEDRALFQRSIRRLARGDGSQAIEIRLQHPTEEPCWAGMNMVVAGATNAEAHYRATLVDISEGIAARQGLERLAAVVSSSDDAIVSRDLGGRVTSWNAAAARLFRYPAKEMLGWTMEELVPPERREEEADLLERVGRGERLADLEMERIAFGGGRLQLSVSLSPVRDDAGRPIGSALIARDIGARKHSEQVQRLRLGQLDLLSHVGRELILGRPDAATAQHELFDRVRETVGAEIYLNYQVSEPSETLTLVFSPALPEAHRAVFADEAVGLSMARRVVRGQAPVVVECVGSSELGETRALRRIGVQCYAAFPLTVEGKVRAVAAFASTSRQYFQEGDAQVIQAVCDQLSAMMQRGQLLNELHAREQSLQQADRAKDYFLAMVAHELRNPLAPIRNAVGILRRSPGLDAQIAWCGDIIERQVEQMTRLMEDLLDASRLSREKIELRCERIALADVIEQALEAARPLMAAQGHRLHLDLPKQPIWLNADLTRLTQVFVNLLNNAAKYTDWGGRIQLSVSRGHDDAYISVRDNGIGIDAEQLPKVFGMFAQLSPALDRSHGGLGIGLSLARTLVELHGGHIEAHSRGLGQGSEFIVRLPVVAAGDAMSDSAATKTRPALARHRLLVVDDNVDAASTLATILSLEGQDVRTAFGSLEALELAEQWRPEVAMVDIGLPELNGYELCRRLRAQPWGERMLLVACTGWGSPEDRKRTGAAGFDFHLVKPIDPEAVLKLMAERDSPAPRSA